MSRSTDLEKEVSRWKDKYFEQGESFEADRKFAEEYAALLQRLLVRVSLAAENVSESLDEELAGLRSAIREATPEKNDLEKRLKRIDALILTADKAKQNNTDRIIAALESMVEQLLSVKLPRKQKSALKKLSRSLQNRGRDWREYPGILSEYAIQQAQVLSSIVDTERQPSGFFSRILGSGSSQTEHTDETQDNTDDLELEVENTAEEDEAIPGFSAISKHIRATLNHLLDQLSFPPSAQKELLRLRQTIETELNWYELGPTLDDLANLVISAVGKGQRDFERFLLVLDERLGKVQSFLSNNQKSEQEFMGKSLELDRVMRARVSEMSKDLSMVSDLEELKFSITGHLDNISQAMDRYAEEHQKHNQEKDEELAALQARLGSMEEESREIRERLKEERSKALTDALTGLPNREAFDERYALEYERWKRYRKPAVLVVGDIDHFKQVNDNYGHLSGDKVLQIMAKEIQARIRKTDFVARYGGEEFVIILPETEPDVARQVMDKTRDMISRLPFHFRDEKIQITMSFGLVPFQDEADQEELFDRADKSLYQAKKAGRNQVILWPDSDSN